VAGTKRQNAHQTEQALRGGDMSEEEVTAVQKNPPLLNPPVANQIYFLKLQQGTAVQPRGHVEMEKDGGNAP
jgi:hypothetical protein